jgi:steroid 5-alpha reductase family enzyme
MNPPNCIPLPASIVGRLLVINAALLLVYMTIWFLVAHKRKRIDTVDTAWGLAFVLVAWATVIGRATTQTILIAILVSIWGVRLASHIYRRARRHGEDRRYQELRSKWKGNVWLRAYVSIFLLQGLLVWIVSLSVVMATNRSLSGLWWLSVVGGLVWFGGFIIETMADHQLRVFLSKKDHPKVLRTGLWRYSRHPNYFGELTQWWGIGIIAAQVKYGWIGLLGPLALSILIIYISGIPPIEKRRAKDPEYRHYQRQTSVLLPWPPRNKTST